MSTNTVQNHTSKAAVRPSRGGTVLLLIGLLFMGLNLGGSDSSQVARTAALGVGSLLVLSAIADVRIGGLANLLRADLFALLALYFLSFFEFLFTQSNFDMMVGAESTRAAAVALLWAFAGIAIGRHLPSFRRRPFVELFSLQVPSNWLFLLFWFCFAMGFSSMLMAVNFNPVELIKEFMGPRFSQPWQRGRFGDWKALLSELTMFLYLIPPMAGVMLGRRDRYSRIQLLMCVSGFLFLLFYGFTSGTRNLFASYLVTFLISYTFARPKRRVKELVVLATACALMMLFATVAVLKFREVGLANYLRGVTKGLDDPHETMFVDLNLYAMTQIMEVFPAHHPFLGWEVPYLALIRPVPRAIWPEKPEGMSSTIEDALGVEGMTIAATFAGEAYMSGGVIAIFAVGLFFGFLAGAWNFLASSDYSDLGVLIYASGFFAAIITMRSMFVLTTALLPTLCGLFIARYLVRKLRQRRARQVLPAHARVTGPPIRR